jgi:phage tail sheath protein FI
MHLEEDAMPAPYSYPGVYVEELPSPVHPVAAVTTSVAAFVDVFASGPVSTPTQVSSFAAFARVFGGFSADSESSYAISQFFLNGGQNAWVVRVVPLAGGNLPGPAHGALLAGSPPQEVLGITAASPGDWGTGVQVVAGDVPGGELFNLYVRQVNGQGQVTAAETFRGLSLDQTQPTYAPNVVNDPQTGSALITVQDTALGYVPFGYPISAGGGPPSGPGAPAFQALQAGDTVPALGSVDQQDVVELLTDPLNQQGGIHLLDRIDPFIFNILCLPATKYLDAAHLKEVADAAGAYAEGKRAMLIIDPPAALQTADQLSAWANDPSAGVSRMDSEAVYFPSLQLTDPLTGLLRTVGPSGTMAGIWARIDASRGVWKSPAGTEATILGASLASTLTDAENGELNPQGINVLRSFPVFGNVSWGARTLLGADQESSQWKYIAVRRTAFFIEESLYEGLKWAVFEPNDEPLWSQIRLNVGSFMQGLFSRQAFQGSTPSAAYFVKCDSDTTTQADIDLGVVNILVGFAPLKPAEFVVLQIQQIAGASPS